MNGFYYGVEGYKLYAQAHSNHRNQLIHGIFTPVLCYGLLLGLIPQTVSTTSRAKVVVVTIFVLYTAYYATFDVGGAILFWALYCLNIQLVFASWSVLPKRSFRYVGGLLVLVSLLAREIGHMVYEGDNTHFTTLLTSITIAPLFGIHSIFGII